jgi:hypothetical protein
MNVEEIVSEWLMAHGYDGLYDPECADGCHLGGLFPCGSGHTCRPGVCNEDGFIVPKKENTP